MTRLVEQLNDYSWRVASFSEAGQEYTVWRNGRGEYRCTCPHHQYRKSICHHIMLIRQIAAKEEAMLLIRRRPGQTVQIGPSTRLTFIGMEGQRARLSLQSDSGQRPYYKLCFPGESVHVSPGVLIRFMGWHHGEALLAFQAPPDVLILRGEVASKVLPPREEESCE